MAKITYPNKNTGDTFSAAEATEVKTSVNALYDAVGKLETPTETIERDANGNLQLKEGSVQMKHIDPAALSNGLLTGAQQTAIINGPWTNKQFGGTLTGAVRGQMFGDGTYFYILIDDNTPIRTALV